MMRMLALAAVVATTWLGLAESARACTPCRLTQILLLGGDTQPANGLLVSTIDYAPELVSITVDGEPALLVDAGIAWPDDQFAWRIEPTPIAGAAIDFGDFVNEVCFGDTPTALAHTAASPDLVAPAAPSALVVDAHVYATLPDDSGCPAAPDVTYWLHGEIDDDDASSFLRVEVLVADDVVHIVHRTLAPGPFDVDVRIHADSLAGVDATQACLRVSTMDVAGNASDPIELCSPCHVRREPADAEPYDGTPPEPTWQDDDVHAGGSCEPMPPPEKGSTSDATSGAPPEPEPEPEATTTAPETNTTAPAEPGVLDRGCACRTAPRTFVPLCALALLALRRRRAR